MTSAASQASATGPNDARLLDLYKLAVEMADRVSARRAGANTLFISIQSAVVTALGFLTARKTAPPEGVLLAICLVGVLGSVIWYVLLLKYRDINRAKFKVIMALEERLPVRLFDEEWKLLEQNPRHWWQRPYSELGTAERLIPLLFAVLNLSLSVYVVAS